MSIINYLRLDFKKVLIINSPTKVEKLFVYDQGEWRSSKNNPNALPNESYLKFLHDLRRYYFPSDINIKSKNIYISRGHFLFKGKKFIGSQYIEKLLYEERNFFTIHPEKWPLIDQLGLILSSKEIIADEGSSLHAIQLFDQIESNLNIIARTPEIKDRMIINCINKRLQNGEASYLNIFFPKNTLDKKITSDNKINIYKIYNPFSLENTLKVKINPIDYYYFFIKDFKKLLTSMKKELDLDLECKIKLSLIEKDTESFLNLICNTI